MTRTRCGLGWVAVCGLLATVALADEPPAYVGQWGRIGSDPGHFYFPFGLAVDRLGQVYVADGYNHRIQKFDAQGRFLAQWGTRGSGPGQFDVPTGLAFDPAGRLYVIDSYNLRMEVFDAAGTFLDEWPLEGVSYWPVGLAIDGDGQVYVTDLGSPPTWPWGSAVVGYDAAGRRRFSWGLPGSGAGEFLGPAGIAANADGDVFVADAGNHRIQRFDSMGNARGAWGTWGVGPGQLSVPLGVALDRDGRVLVVDSRNHRVEVFDPDGHLRTSFGSRGIGPGQLFEPYYVAADARGNVYVSDTYNHRIQKWAWAREVEVDVHPGTFPNPINLKAHGVVPVAILTTPEFDATTIDPGSLRAGPGEATTAHPSGHLEDVDRDGDLDLLVHFPIDELGLACGDPTLSLAGTTWAGEPIEGSDAIETRGCTM